MCGLFGIAGDFLTEKHKSAFQQGLYVAALRGWDATGVANVGHKSENGIKSQRITYFKDAVSAPDFLCTKGYKETMNATYSRALIGHCRSKTIGMNIMGNAHPFNFDKIIGVHNGTLGYGYPNPKKYDSDSQALFHTINIEPTVAGAMAKISGAYALVWFNKEGETLNFLRNGERELWFGVGQDPKVLFWASERQMLSLIMARNGFGVTKIARMKPDTHIKINLMDANPMDTVVVSEVKGKERYVYDKDDRFFPTWRGEDWWEGLGSGWTPRETTPKAGEATGQQVVVWEGKGVPIHGRAIANDATSGSPAKGSTHVSLPNARSIKNGSISALQARVGTTKLNKNKLRGYRGAACSREEIETTLADGCISCGHTSTIKEGFRWINYNDYLCQSCNKSPAYTYPGSILDVERIKAVEEAIEGISQG